ncbi:hypothetical protein OG429_06625 [Streptomyces sp. NBC_00190]|uniref:hypothetical protein n=1 Tax=unclassified Streptomyces TaxID=2593676 RepID=UPI002E2D16CA|nr:hypothetical protein [Streptomyces sp. NBC_00190]WSZ39038.1 hypothetical protein OG239_09630 [Streptomyces sp. NBC_00868]
MSSKRPDLEQAAALTATALVPLGRKPSEVKIAGITDGLIDQEVLLAAAVEHLPGGAVARATWEGLVFQGPEDTPLGNWAHSRALARTVRRMTEIMSAAPKAVR